MFEDRFYQWVVEKGPRRGGPDSGERRDVSGFWYWGDSKGLDVRVGEVTRVESLSRVQLFV